jgi:hypothetical protein
MKPYTKCAVLNLILLASVTRAAEQSEQANSVTTNSIPAPELSLSKSTIWQDGVGNGFVAGARDFSAEAGAMRGVIMLGGREEHDLGLLSLTYGQILGRIIGEDHWYRGNFEGRLEVLGGMQFHPDQGKGGWLIGLTPHIRYDFATGSRWIPFFDLGAGVTATGISRPDLSGIFEFNLQATTGVHYMLRDNLALTGDVRYMHVSCGGIHSPNLGMNGVAFMLGLTWFFGK